MMFEINGNEITITKGDTALIDFEVDGYKFVEGDVVYFSVKKNPKETNCIIQKAITVFDNNIARIELDKQDTKIGKGKYWYDIQCSLVDGRIDTVINKERFIVLEEINNE